MSRVSAILENDMRRRKFVSAAVACVQYNITRTQLLDLVLQGRVRPLKPDGAASFFVSWEDLLKELGSPAEFRAKPRLEQEIVPEELIELEGMISEQELTAAYEAEADAAAEKRSAKQAAAAVAPQQRITIKPSDYNVNSTAKE